MASEINSHQHVRREIQDVMSTSGVSPSTLGEECRESFFHYNFYKDEYKRLVSKMYEEEFARRHQTVKPFQELLQLSMIADEDYFVGKPWDLERQSRVDVYSLLEWKRFQDKWHAFFMSGMRSLEESDRERTRYKNSHWRKPIKDAVEARIGINDLVEHNVQKEKLVGKMKQSNDGEPKDTILCHHFVKGYCKLGESCTFLHSGEHSHPDSQKLFLGGLPINLTSESLVFALRQKGYSIINKPKIFRRFCPQICLGSVEEAQRMLREGKITILGCRVDVRPYKACTQMEMDRQLNINNRSVFLGGVPPSITVNKLKSGLEKLGMKVTNYPRRKSGYIPKVTLATLQQAKQLIAEGILNLNGAAITVRPYKLGHWRAGKNEVTKLIHDAQSLASWKE